MQLQLGMIWEKLNDEYNEYSWCEKCEYHENECICGDVNETDIIPQRIQLTEDSIPGLVASLQSKDKADIDLAQNIINNRDKSNTSEEVFDKLLNGMLNSDTCLTHVKTKELYIIKVNNTWVKPSNSGNGFYKSKKGAQKALNTMLHGIAHNYWPYSSKPLQQTIAHNIPNIRYKDPKYKTSGHYLKGGDALVKFFYDNNKVEFIKIEL